MPTVTLKPWIIAFCAWCVTPALFAQAPATPRPPPRFIVLDYTGVALSRDSSFELTLLPLWSAHQRLIAGPTLGLHRSGRSQVELEAALDMTSGAKRSWFVNAAAGTLLDEKGTVWTASTTIYFVFTPYYRQYRVDGETEQEIGLKIKLPIMFLAAFSMIGGR